MNNDGLTLNQLAERNAALVTEVEKLRAERDQLAAENVALKSFGDKLNDMHNALNGEGIGIQGRAEVACQQVALEAAIEEFDAIETPATYRIVAGIKADGVEQYAALFADTVNMEREHNQQFHKGTLWFAKQLREGANHD
ncbi:Uncharacterised protein [Klebsiella pneumoniae]|uniref:hypothetical protein n=1 Tax=Klebsiella pneumoniae TaxID=573 RepID=UPI000E2A886C|nr:hypothetical protein [Klebsiella pneumoniae]SWF05497.1 Uncharacterised protein [Klebsiella pneumoniae]